jgi:3-hydroxyisobutyrate dehydrogenase
VAAGEKIGWIGLGQIGTPMATRLLGNPGGLVVCDIVEEATRTFAAEGAEVADDPAGVVAAGATVISVMVRDDAQVRTVVGEIVAVARPGTLVAIHSTIRPQTAEELAAAAADAGVVVLDAPVSGGVAGASTGRLVLLLGGDEAAVERCRAVYAPLADLVVHFGPAGAGTRAKIARNLVGFAGYVAVDEAMRLAEALGLDLKGLGQVIRHSDAVTGGAGAVALRSETGPLPEDHWLRPVFGHSAALGEKDLDLALGLATEAGVDLPMAATARDRLAAALGVADEAG